MNWNKLIHYLLSNLLRLVTLLINEDCTTPFGLILSSNLLFVLAQKYKQFQTVLKMVYLPSYLEQLPHCNAEWLSIFICKTREPFKI
jgi:hypothetical protein